jgi:hypothetical protein
MRYKVRDYGASQFVLHYLFIYFCLFSGFDGHQFNNTVDCVSLAIYNNKRW